MFKHQLWDHEILFEKNKKLTFGPIYKFDILRNYIDENIRKNIFENPNRQQNTRFFSHRKKLKIKILRGLQKIQHNYELIYLSQAALFLKPKNVNSIKKKLIFGIHCQY